MAKDDFVKTPDGRPLSHAELVREAEALAAKIDRDATAEPPNDIIRHLSISHYSPADRAKPTLSHPEGYSERVAGLDLHWPAAKAQAVDEALALFKSEVKDHAPFVPKHLDVRTFPRIIPSVEFRGGLQLLWQQLGSSSVRQYPWSAIGRVMTWGDGRYLGSGTGFMVGPNLLMTASHCLPWDYSGNCHIEFTPAAHPSNPPPFGKTHVTEWYGWPRYGSSWELVFKADAKDIAICRTGDPIGNICGWLGTQSFADHDEYYRHWYASVGYPGVANGFPMAELLLRMKDVDGDNDGRELETHNFGSPGWSGGPLFGYIHDDWRAVGTAHGMETEFRFGIPPWTVNFVFAGGRNLVRLVEYGYRHWQ